MAAIITGETIKSAVGMEIMRAFPGITWYKEANIINPRFPHFFVQQLTLSKVQERHNRWWLEYLMTIRYRQVSDPTTSSTIQELLDGVGLDLLDELQRITVGNLRVPIRELRYEKVDGVLHAFGNIRLQVTKPQAEYAKMNELELTKTLHN